jgi:hypothetical protein
MIGQAQKDQRLTKIALAWPRNAQGRTLGSEIVVHREGEFMCGQFIS